ncbi:hypothetical protein FRB99_004721 [Tulasnella sp. 403]|nr:hypothetical protein FRB99_004721 [Tulasnella sp. 403]
MSPPPMLKRGEACAECRRRKLRCDGAKPHCTICVRANRECRYEKLVTRPVYVVLQERLSKLEQKFRLLTGTSQVEPTTQPDQIGPALPIQGPLLSSLSSTGVPVSMPALPQEMAGRWFDAEVLAPPIRDYLINVFVQHHDNIHFWFHIPTFMARIHSSDPQEQPHPALVESMYLLACYFSSRMPESHSLMHHEEHFLARARRALMESLSFSDRLMDFLRGSILVTAYLFMRGRFLEGYHVHCGAARFALSCGLHRIRSSLYVPNSPLPMSTNLVLLAPATSQIELGERITTFWMIYAWDKISSVIAGFVGALPTDSDQIDAIETVFPRSMEEYEKGDVRASNDQTLKDLLDAGRLTLTGREPSQHQDIPWTIVLKALTLLERATRLGATCRIQGPTPSNLLSLRQLEAISNQFKANLPAVSSLAPIDTLASDASLAELSNLAAFVGHTITLGALMEIQQTLVNVDDQAYDTRLACAKSMAGLATTIKDGGFQNGSLISAGVLIQHIGLQQAQDTVSADDYESLLTNIVSALEKLSVTFPTLVHQFKQVQQAMGRISGSGEAGAFEADFVDFDA